MSHEISKDNPTIQGRRQADTERGLDRRGFLKISSAAAAVAVAAPALGSTETRAKTTNPPQPRSQVKDLKGGWFVV